MYMEVYSILLILFHRRTIFKMLAIEQLAEKWTFSTGGSSDRFRPLATTYVPVWGGMPVKISGDLLAGFTGVGMEGMRRKRERKEIKGKKRAKKGGF